MKPQIILLGAPGSGKGTQAAQLVEKLGYTHISTGELLRKEINEGSDLGNKVKSVMDKGDLVDDDTVLELLKKNCDLENNAYIFDGFPRNYEQAKLLDNVVLKDVSKIAIYFDIDLEVIVERVTNRRVAPKSGEIYNLKTKPPKTPGKCDISGEELIQRKDDNEETVRNRLNVFKSTVDPVLEYYNKTGDLVKVDASRSPDEVMEQLLSVID
jgi:adenylate kinase